MTVIASMVSERLVPSYCPTKPVRLQPTGQRRLGDVLTLDLGLTECLVAVPRQRVPGTELAGRDEAPVARIAGPPDQVVGSDVELVTGLGVDAQNLLPCRCA